MSNDEDVYNINMRAWQANIAQEQVNYQNAQYTGDLEEQARASRQMATDRATMREFHAMAVERVQAMRPAEAPNEFGLSPAESEVAKFSGITEQEYAANKAKLARMRARGEYRDQTN